MILLLAADAWAVRPTEGGLFSFFPEDDVRTFDDPSGRVRVHWSAAGPSAAPDDDADGDGTFDYAQDAAEIAVQALDLYAAAGFRAPLSEADVGLGDLGGSPAIDLYLVDFDGNADGNFGVDACTGSGPSHCGGYVALENDFRGYAYPSPRAGLEVVVPHELFHGVQYAYHGELSLWASEGTALWAERFFDPESEDFVRFCDSYLAEPTRSIDEPPVGPIPNFAYSTGLWFDFLTLRHDADLLGEILEGWEASPDDQTAPMLAAVEARGDTVSDAWRTFAGWNLATGVRAGSMESYPYAERLTAIEPEDGGGVIDDDNRFYPLATTYYRLNHGGGELWFGLEEAAPGLFFSVHPTVDGSKEAPVLPAIAEFWGDDPAPASLGDLPEGFYWIWGTQPEDGDSSIKVRFCAGAEDDVLACFADPEPTTEPPLPDEGADEKGCGCSDAPSAPLAPALLGVLGLVYRPRVAFRPR